MGKSLQPILLACAAALAAASACFPSAAAAAPSAPAPDAVPGELLVRFERDATAADRTRLRDAVGAELEDVLPLRGVQRVELPRGASVAQAAARLERSPAVAYAEPNFRRRASVPANDTYFEYLFGLHNTGDGPDGGTADADIDAPEAWDLTQGSATVRVAVVDTGVYRGHPDLSTNVWVNPGESGAGKASNGLDDDGNGRVDDVNGWDLVDGDNAPDDLEGHGTHVAGTVGAQGNNGTGVTGVSWDVSLMPVRVLDENGSGSVADVAAGYLYASQNGAKVINASLGGPDLSNTEVAAIQSSPQSLFVVAAGNAGESNELVPEYPCNHTAPNVVCVAATDRFDELASFSNYGATSVDLAAPGDEIVSTYPEHLAPFSDYLYMSGTSMATPHVAGVAALAWARNPSATVAEVKTALLSGADPKASLVGSTVTGGRLNARGTLALVSAGSVITDPDPGPSPSPSPQPDPDPTPTPSRSQPAPATADNEPPGASISVKKRHRISTSIRNGLNVRLGCSERCDTGLRLLLDRKSAKRLRIASKQVAVARTKGRVEPGARRTFKARLSKKARRRIAGAKKVTVTAMVRVVDGAGNSRYLKRRLTLTR